MEQFPLKREEDAAIYRNARGRIFAWQATFKLSLWNRVVRALGRSEIEIRQEAEARARRSAKSAAAPPAAASPRRRPAAPPALPAAARPAVRAQRSASARRP